MALRRPLALPESTPALLGWLSLYFALHMAARLFAGGGLWTDEAEQILLAQEWRLGYGAQGPLFTWLQRLVFAATGTNLLGIMVLRCALLVGVWGMFHRVALAALRRADLALLATALLAFIPYVVWDSPWQRTHTVLACLFSGWTILLFLRLLRARTLSDYLLLGLVAAAGVLAKYNYALLLAALVAASATMPSGRALLSDRRILLSVALLFSLLLPHALWAWNHPDLLLSRASRLEIDRGAWALDVAKGFGWLVLSVIRFAGIPLLIGAWLLRRKAAAGARRDSDPEAARWLRRSLWGAIALCFVGVLVLGVGRIKARWLQPVILFLPVVLVDRVADRLTPRRIRAIAAAAALVALGAWAGLYGTTLFAGAVGRSFAVNFGFGRLAEQLRAAGFREGTILAEDRWLGGNLLLHFPRSAGVVPEIPYIEPRAGGSVLVVWDAVKRPRPDASLLELARARGLGPLDPGQAAFFEAEALHGERGASRLGCFLLPAGPATPAR